MDSKGKQKESKLDKESSQLHSQEQHLDDDSQDNSYMPGLEYEEEEEEERDHEEDDIHYDNRHEQHENEDDEDDDDEEDEGDEEEMMNELSRVRRALGLQMEDLFGSISSDSSRFRSILVSLKNQEEPTMQLVALQELAEILSVSNEDNLVGYFSCDSFVKELVRIMSGPEIIADMDDDMMLALAMSEGLDAGNPEIMLLACRCISNLLDAMPTAATSIVFHGGIKVLCQKLKSIQYIDLAEQALCALEKISAQVPRAVVHESGLSASLMYFDFFSVHAQRTALRTASNCLRNIDQESFLQVTEVTPTLMNAMSYSDRTVVELTCVCWVRISESYRSQRESLERVISVDLLKALFGLIPVSGNSNAVRPATFQDILRVFRSVAKTSPQLSFELLKMDILGTFYRILTGSAAVTEQSKLSHVTLDSKWRESVPTIIKTMADLLPPLPKDGMFSSRRFKEGGPVASRTRSALPSVSGETETVTKDPRIEWFEKNPEFLVRTDTILLPLFLDMYTSTVNVRVRQLITHTMLRLIHYTSAQDLENILKNVSLSSFLSGILTRQEQSGLIIDALYHAELLIKKLPNIYHVLFEREGVFHEIESLSKLPLLDDSQQSQTDNTVDESDATTTDAEKKQEGEDEEESEQEERKESTAGGSSQDKSSVPQRRILDRNDLQALLRGRYGLLQPPRTSRHHRHSSESEKGIGKGSVRKYIIQLAQHFVNNYFHINNNDGTPSCIPGSSLKEVSDFTNKIMNGDKESILKTLVELSTYLKTSLTGISSFELINSGLMKALLSFLTLEEGFNNLSLHERRKMFEEIFMDKPDIDDNCNNSLKKLVIRLHEILSRFETFEVVSPLESSSSDGLRNPTSMLAKQLRLRLTGKGDNIPGSYKQLMVSTHAVATFRVLEEYLLTRIRVSSVLEDNGDADEEEDDEDEEHMLLNEGRNEEGLEEEEGEEEMDLDEEDDEMSEAVEVKHGDTEDEDEASSLQDKHAKADNSHATSSGSDAKKKDGEWRIRFSLNGTVISNDATVYAAVHQYEMREGTSQTRLGRSIWSSSYPVTFERVWVSNSETTDDTKKSTVVCQLTDSTQPKELTDDSSCAQVLFLMKALSTAITKKSVGISPQDFINRKLTAKMNRQLEEPLIVASSCLPSWTYWLMSTTPFLFPFETRYLFIQSTSFGYSRLISRWQSLQMRNNTQNGPRDDGHQSQQPILGRMERQKVRIVRSQMLESAIKIFDLFGSSPGVLEIEYVGEEGTGLGPTLEFYASTSKEFSKHSINMWRGSIKNETGYVDDPLGLFPKPLAKSNSKSVKKTVQLFRTLGQFVAKAMLDFRIIDIRFNSAFFKIALEDAKPSHELLVSMSQKMQEIESLQVEGVQIQDLCLDFTLPGDATYELKPDGAEIPVTIQNVEQYVEAIIDAVTGSGVSQQIEAFKEGFNDLFAIEDLKLLTYSELVSLFGTSEEDWSLSTLADTIKADHGFTIESKSVQYLLEILSEMDNSQRREFLQFTTGSPRLPIGGWKALRPVFTVVRKVPESSLSPDDYLPSVMTCANYLKMPEYSSKEIMRQKLEISMKEGQNSFLLS
ncbi:hypothetical protein RO3G_00779 [Rhizopus delemar RA 99-880]|uniref:HECT-type E3 ubiquitin transferase n=1 Tax=Rhizopus delemar (strain RA 99-880 / ATCC MYA-4621 / FGSC 9543 / NRRL 43880) TaxID=246409 RepID=I1BIP5_RHIO9|nr:hypothetical protein RO3G_00779 [Rhizopus delemar RA 99-880]|eukprot:EIE76075.1 hypothetical protein RO3G_00779 [Rhizopus delemar RA 99-880]